MFIGKFPCSKQSERLRDVKEEDRFFSESSTTVDISRESRESTCNLVIFCTNAWKTGVSRLTRGLEERSSETNSPKKEISYGILPLI